MTIAQPDARSGAIYQDLAHAEALLASAEADLAAGRNFSLVEFNATLDMVCVGAVKLPQSEFKSVRKQLKALIARLQLMREDVVRIAPAA